jgi:hypothetical protein
LGAPNRPDFPLPLISPHTHNGTDGPDFRSRIAHQENQATRRSYSIANDFFAGCVCSHGPTKYHGTTRPVPKAGIR